MRVGILGSGDVGKSLAAGFVRHGHQAMLGTRNPGRVEAWASQHPEVAIGTFAATTAFGELVVLAVKGGAASDALREAAAVNLVEHLQRKFPAARFVKAFNSVGSACMVDPQFRGGKPTMFICGNDAEAKQVVTAILEQFGWESADMGSVEAARAIEPLCILWCIPGFLRQDWNHAFKLLQGQ
jgi:predicted dinucleotide-binding enzyme